MARRGHGRRRGHGDHEEGHESDERWLLTYADMITLLMALFMVMFSISSVNKSKFETLQRTLKEAFSGKILPGGQSIQQAGSNPNSENPAPEAPFPSAEPTIKGLNQTQNQGEEKDAKSRYEAARDEQREFEQVERKLEEFAKANGLAAVIETEITPRGLVIRLRTDRVLFDSGRAEIKPGAESLLAKVAGVVAPERNPVAVEGHTDSIPIHGRYPTNWELSTARASSVARFMLSHAISPKRLSATGYSYYQPIAPNGTAQGRSRNRRVEVVLLRRFAPDQSQGRD